LALVQPQNHLNSKVKVAVVRVETFNKTNRTIKPTNSLLTLLVGGTSRGGLGGHSLSRCARLCLRGEGGEAIQDQAWTSVVDEALQCESGVVGWDA
jgi:hypothetical protein